ncbi:hypothetical protein ES703_79608 [subsurface metagenome]
MVRQRNMSAMIQILTLRMVGIRVEISITGGRGSKPIRTASEIAAHIKILPAHQPNLYQKLSPKGIQLRLLGMSYQ